MRINTGNRPVPQTLIKLHQYHDCSTGPYGMTNRYFPHLQKATLYIALPRNMPNDKHRRPPARLAHLGANLKFRVMSIRSSRIQSSKSLPRSMSFGRGHDNQTNNSSGSAFHTDSLRKKAVRGFYHPAIPGSTGFRSNCFCHFAGLGWSLLCVVVVCGQDFSCELEWRDYSTVFIYIFEYSLHYIRYIVKSIPTQTV